ncbi:transposase [Micromonospora sp. WMMD1082]|nr:transposase [Micromonospora sp. WMMD1082]MDG4796722.1 transposase [Micromonospora sp. WMMD1082]
MTTGTTNAGSEGTNRVIKTIARDAYGSRNPETSASAPAPPPRPNSKSPQCWSPTGTCAHGSRLSWAYKVGWLALTDTYRSPALTCHKRYLKLTT